MCSPQEEDWGGDINHNCNARLVSTGGMNFPPVVVFSYLVVCLGLFFAFPARVLLWEYGNAAGVVLGAVLGAVALATFFLAALSDPGVVPGRDEPLHDSGQVRPPRIQKILTSTGRTQLTYCEECHVFRGKTTEHCPQTSNCISRFDHFCPWIGNDVGARNYLFFFLFLVSVGLLVGLVVACAVAQLVLELYAVEALPADAIGTICLLILVAFASLFALPLCAIHVKLAGEGRTTQESMVPQTRRKQLAVRWRLSTLVATLCRERSPSLVRRRVDVNSGKVAMAAETSARDFMARKQMVQV